MQLHHLEVINMVWRKTNLRNGFRLSEGNKVILVHTDGTEYWIDFWSKNAPHTRATAGHVNTLEKVWKLINEVKKN